MSRFPVKKTINDLNVTFLKMNNRERSRVKRLWTVATIAVMNDSPEKFLTQEQMDKLDEVELKRYESEMEIKAGLKIMKMRTHENYEIVRDLMFNCVNIEGSGNALELMDGYGNCFDDDETLEGALFMQGVDLYEGKPKGSTDTESTPA